VSVDSVCLRAVSYSYPDTKAPVLDHLDLEFPLASFSLITGPSGSGKSTLLRCLNGLVPHFYGGVFSGRVGVLGRDPVALGPRHMSDLVGFVFQDPDAQFIVDSVADEIAFSMEARAYSREVMAERIEEVAAILGIKHLLGRRMSTLSGGQRQRVAVAAALALQPKILVLDEPTSQLDPVAAEELLSALVRLNHEYGLTIFLSEHRLERVVQHVDCLLYMPGNGGRRLVGSPGEVLPQVPLAPPVVQLAKALRWQPIPLTVEEALARLQRHGASGGGNGRNRKAPGPVRLLVEGIEYAYDGRPAIEDLDLALRQGEIVAVQGHNGAGKTTLLKAILGLLRPQRGLVLLDGQDVSRLSTHEVIQKVGYVPQSPGSLLFQETVLEELQFTRHSHGLPSQDFMPLLERLDLAQYAHVYPRDLSQGERQRVALAAILVAEPDILLLDEPTLGLDYIQKNRLVQLLLELREEGKAILMATHDVELVAMCADRTLVLQEGRLLTEGETGQVMVRRPEYASQISRLFNDGVHLTVEDVIAT